MIESVMNKFIAIIFVQLFFSMAITTIVYKLPSDVRENGYTDLFSNKVSAYNVTTISDKVQDNLNSHK